MLTPAVPAAAVPAAPDFTLAGYRDLVARLLARGYRSVGFDQADPAACHLVLRHDLDMSIQAARRVADVEAALGVTATYFVLVRSDIYNPGAPANQADLAAIAALGHEIGLHFDAAPHADDDAALAAAADQDCALLAMLTGQPVRTISFHRPARRLQGRPGRLAGRSHAYEPRFFHAMGYCSDSRGGWHYGHPLDHPAIAAGRALQLLTHPIWWQADARYDGPVATLDRFRQDRDRVLATVLADHCQPYRDAGRAAAMPVG